MGRLSGIARDFFDERLIDAGWPFDFDERSFCVAEQDASERRFHREKPSFDIGLIRPDKPHSLDFSIAPAEHHGAPETNHAVIFIRRMNDPNTVQRCAHHRNASVQLLLGDFTFICLKPTQLLSVESLKS